MIKHGEIIDNTGSSNGNGNYGFDYQGGGL